VAKDADTMPICASCGQPVDAARAQRNACPSCTWRAALRLSQTTTTDEAEGAGTDLAVLALDADDAGIQIGDDPVTLVTRLQDLAAATPEPIDDHRARRIYLALLNGNTRPYRAEMNRLVSRYIDTLEQSWTV
jgi:predicted RNA-binding Zn-ribbon protein involved in translation (DUF1610 family)